jgi:3-deoxy-D-manno-octulosonic-acid transferase
VGPHSETERRLREAGALRRATTGNELGAAVIDLLAPERAARMAHRAWEVSSEGSEVAGRIIDLIDGFVAGKGR